MKISARNSIQGTVKKVLPGSVNTEVAIEVAPGVEIVSIITKTAAENMGFAEGKQVYAVIKSSDVMVATE